MISRTISMRRKREVFWRKSRDVRNALSERAAVVPVMMRRKGSPVSRRRSQEELLYVQHPIR